MTDCYENIRNALAAEIEALRETLATLKAENERLQAEVGALREALQRYGVHDHTCTAMDIPICTCGLDAALELGRFPAHINRSAT